MTTVIATSLLPAALAAALLHQAQTGQLDKTQFSPKVSAALTAGVEAQFASTLRPLGDPSTYVLVAKKRKDDLTMYVYRAESKTGAIEESMVLDENGKVAGLWFKPAPPLTAAGDSSALALAKTLLHQAQAGQIDRSKLSADLNSTLTSTSVAEMKDQLAPLGPASAFTLQSRTKDSSGTTYYYRVAFANTGAYEELSLDSHGKVAGLWFKPAP